MNECRNIKIAKPHKYLLRQIPPGPCHAQRPSSIHFIIRPNVRGRRARKVAKQSFSVLVHARSFAWECPWLARDSWGSQVSMFAEWIKNWIRFTGPYDELMSVCFRVKRGLTLMEMIMRNGLFQTALCLVGISAPVNCQVNWKNGKVSDDKGRKCELTLNIEEEKEEMRVTKHRKVK